ncbi:MAG: IclR family transcriptional regulator [Dongiaceae bacterium]
MAEPSEPLCRAAVILDAVGASPDGLEVARIARFTGLPLPTAHRIVRNLAGIGYLAQAGRGGPYKLGPRLLRLLNHGITAEALHAACTPILKAVADKCGAVAFLIRMHNERAITELQVLPDDRRSAIVLPGSDLPLHATASGKVFLAAMPVPDFETWLKGRTLERYRPATITDPAKLRRHVALVRRRGYSTCRDEFDEGTYSLATLLAPPGLETAYATGVVGFERQLLKRRTEAEYARIVRRMVADLGPRIAALTA